jgi:hypothetical protein
VAVHGIIPEYAKSICEGGSDSVVGSRNLTHKMSLNIRVAKKSSISYNIAHVDDKIVAKTKQNKTKQNKTKKSSMS